MLRSALNLNRFLRSSFLQCNTNTSIRFSSTDQSKSFSTGESLLVEILKQKFPKAKYIEVQDISGGCGAMYEIFVETADFKGLNTVKQHRLVTEALKAEIKDMHGVRIHTKLPTEKNEEL